MPKPRITLVINLKWWHAPIAMVGIFLGVPFAIGLVSGFVKAIQVESFSDEESAIRDALLPMGDRLVLTKPDLANLSEDLKNCASGDGVSNRIIYDLAPQGGLDEVDIREHRFSDAFASAYCTTDYEFYVASNLWLPSKKGELTYASEVNAELADGDAKDLERLVEAQTKASFSGSEITEASWMSLPTLGHTRYGFKFTAKAKEREADVYFAVFTRGVAYAATMMVVPTGLQESEVTSIVYAFDAKIQAQIESTAIRAIPNR